MDQRRIEQLVADHLAGDPLRLVAARYGRSMRWVRQTLERFGISTNCRHSDAINHRDEIRAAYWAGQTLGELVDQWGVDAKTITTWVYCE